MKMFEIGRLCVKIAGRDARLKCVIVDTVDELYVMIDGQTRRRKCNINHIEPLDKVLNLNKGASHEEVVKVLKAEGIEVKERAPKKEKPVKIDKPKESKKKPETKKPKAEKPKSDKNKVTKKE